MKRRSLLGVVAGGVASLAGCAEQRSRARYLKTDEVPDSDQVNRKCEIKPTRNTGGDIKPTPGSGFKPFVFAYSGRDDLRGYNQTFEVTMTTDHPVNVFVVNKEEQDLLIEHEQMKHSMETLKNGTTQNSSTATNLTENQSTQSPSEDGSENSTNMSKSGEMLASVSRPKSAEVIATDVTETSFTTRVAMSQTKNMVFTPTVETVSELPVGVELNMKCRYFLPYEEYKEYQSNNS